MTTVAETTMLGPITDDAAGDDATTRDFIRLFAAELETLMAESGNTIALCDYERYEDWITTARRQLRSSTPPDDDPRHPV